MAYQPKSYKKFVATAATATLVATAIVPVASAADAKSFKDVSSTYKVAVDYLVANDITQGMTETTFGTTKSITRGDAAIMIAKALKLNTTSAANAGFKDVNKRVAGAVNAVVEAKIASGTSKTTFNPDANITRQEMAKMIANAYNLKAGTTKNEFKDVNNNWDAYVDALLANGITLGKTATTFAATASVTRGEFALFVHRSETLAPAVVVEKVTVVNETTTTVAVKVANKELKASDFKVLVNGVAVSPTKVESDAKGEVYTITHASLKDTKGIVSVNGSQANFDFTAPVVESVKAINATQVEVKFNVAVDATDAETVARYAINGTAPTSASLDADKKTVTLTFATAAQVEVTNGVIVVEPVMTAANTDVKTEKFSKILTYEDTVKPTISSITSKTNASVATELTVKASEPITSSLAKVNGTYYAITFVGDTGTITGLNLDASKAHTLELINLTDKGGNVTVSTTQSFSITSDKVAPTATLSTQSDKGILVTFDKPMNVSSVVAGLASSAVKNELLADVAYTAPVAAVAGSNNTQFVIDVTASLFGTQNSRNLSVVIPATVKDSLGNAYVAGSKQVTLTKDTVKPAFTGYKVIKNSTGEVTSIEVNFSEGLEVDANPAEPTIVDMNGVSVTSTLLGGLTANPVTAGDKKVTYVAGTPAKLTGKYAFSFGTNLVTDRSESANKSAAFNTTVDFGNGSTTFSLASNPTSALNVITVAFGTAVKGGAVANSATDVANYTLGGKPLPAGTSIVLLPGQASAQITLPTGSIAKTDASTVFTASNILSLNGETLSPYTGTLGVIDNVAPVLTAATLTTDNKMVVTFSEALAAAPTATEFVVKLNGKTVATTPVFTAGAGSDAGKYVVDLDALVKNDATQTYIDLNNDGNYVAADDIFVRTEGTKTAVSISTNPAVSSTTLTVIAAPAITKDTSSLNNLLTGGTVITVK